MDSQASNSPFEKSGLIPLSEHPTMDRLAEILGKLPQDRQEVFGEWLDSADTQDGVEVTKDESEQG